MWTSWSRKRLVVVGCCSLKVKLFQLFWKPTSQPSHLFLWLLKDTRTEAKVEDEMAISDVVDLKVLSFVISDPS